MEKVTKQPIDCTTMPYDVLLGIIVSGCKFKYYSYDHKKALQEYRTSDDYKEVRKWVPNPSCWEIPQKLKEKYRVEKIGKLREVHFDPTGKAYRFKIGARYAKTYRLKDFGVNVFPLV